MLSRGLEGFGKSWNTFVQGCHAFDRVGLPLYRFGITLYRVGMLSTWLECSRQRWNASDRVGTLSTELESLCTCLECFLVGWNAF
jgi:hypothetical protein